MEDAADSHNAHRVEQLVAAASALPPRISPDEAADTASTLPPAAKRLLTSSLVKLIQSLVNEVETSRSELLDAQASLASVLRRVQMQHENFNFMRNSAETMEHTVNELAESNTTLRYQLLQRKGAPNTKSKGVHGAGRKVPTPYSLAEREALELAARDWEVRADADAGAPSAQPTLYLVAEPDGPRGKPWLSVAGAKVQTRPTSAQTKQQLLAAARQRHADWENGLTGTMAEAASAVGRPGSAASRRTEEADGPLTPAHHHFGASHSTSPYAPAPSDACQGAMAAASRSPPPGQRCARPWSQRAEQLGSLRASGREAAAAAAAANAAASALSAGQHRYHVSQQRTASPDRDSSPIEPTGYAASPSHVAQGAWRLTHKPVFARSFSAGPLRSPNGKPRELGEAAARAKTAELATPLTAATAGGGTGGGAPSASPASRPQSASKAAAQSAARSSEASTPTSLGQRQARTTGYSTPSPFVEAETRRAKFSPDERRGSFSGWK